jgi:hypothetical protein
MAGILQLRFIEKRKKSLSIAGKSKSPISSSSEPLVGENTER